MRSPSHDKSGRLADERGFALVTAIVACVVLFALAMLVINFSTGDLRVSARSVGDKKAAIAAEAGLQQLMANFDPLSLTASATTSSTANAVQISGIWYAPVNTANDPSSVYNVSTPAAPTSGPSYLSLTGYSVGGGQSWGQLIYETTITGQNTRYGTSVRVGVGVGYGPVEISTMSR